MRNNGKKQIVPRNLIIILVVLVEIMKNQLGNVMQMFVLINQEVFKEKEDDVKPLS